jgi:hypothetical protein
MKLFVAFFCVCFLLLSFAKINAGIISGGREKIVFSASKIQKDVTWSKNFSLNETGLETQQLPNKQVQDIWILSHAFPIGLSWRPPSNATFILSIDGKIETPEIFIRYSCDKVRWSTWYEFNKTDKKTKDGFDQYETKISVPYSQDKYQKLMREWWKTKPNWSSDEHEFCEWLIKKEPNFFENEFPFIGYVQVLIEKNSVQKMQTIKSLNIEYLWSVGGLQSIPEDQTKVRKNTEYKWFFEGKKQNS